MPRPERGFPGHEPLFDVRPVTEAGIEVYYADRSLETFGWRGAGWFWWPRQRGFSPDSPAVGPFPICYPAYRHAFQGELGHRATSVGEQPKRAGVLPPCFPAKMTVRLH